ncbi:hypothetical protein JL720_4005 [Aureococcus anophagefferens]|nr:hypothetical protein JL720_4005 [Aureococcus anophagefferens]
MSGPRDGISKSTYASSEPLKGERFLVDFFPASKETNECPGNVCNCSWHGEAFEVYEGRTALDASGFGLHLVDTEKSTAGGLPVKKVEDHFAEKLEGAKGYDAFYDYATGLCLESSSFDLVLHKLERAAHDYLPYAFDDSAGRTWYGALVRVPASQMVIDMLTDTSPKLHAVAANLTVLENRLPPRQAVRCKEAFQKNASHTVAYVSRAASDLDAVHAWYDAMNATLSYHSHHTAPEVVTVLRPARRERDAGAFKVADFERMLLSVHGAVVGGDPNCNMDAWADNHYAVDATHDYDFVHAWLRANPSQPYVCQGENVHFLLLGLGLCASAGAVGWFRLKGKRHYRAVP